MNKVNWYGDNTFSWNPIVMRCSRVSLGCDNCWHLRFAARAARNPNFSEAVRASYAGGKPVLRQRHLERPIRHGQPAVIAVQFMGDLFHYEVTDSIRDVVRDVMESALRHQFLLLTKRALALRDFSPWASTKLPDNVWAGVTVEDQSRADERLRPLVDAQAAHRWVSVEPLLGPIDLGLTRAAEINWVVLGCESGPNRRPCKIEWAQSIIAQCRAAGVPVWVKQWGVNGKVTSDPAEFPEALRVREKPPGLQLGEKNPAAGPPE